VKGDTSMAVAAVGLITDVEQAEKIVANGEADAVLLGRELLRNPSWARHAARELGGDVHVPDQYHIARELGGDVHVPDQYHRSV
ncbi:tRNA-dihydrouridine synthase, partial [Streptomyces sp. ActVer]|uniref:oxidoreductase n=1 Tax=Streptomyces sp. ActVer TaxID=3014558 RepID=UPI0022B5484D